MSQPLLRPSVVAVCVILVLGCSSENKSAASSASAAPGVQRSAFERFADAVCACTNEKCVTAAFSAFENANAKRSKSAPLSPADEAAMKRGEQCIDKIVPEK